MSDAAISMTIEWFGCATFRVRAGELTLFFDTYLAKATGATLVGNYESVRLMRLQYGAPTAILPRRSPPSEVSR